MLMKQRSHSSFYSQWTFSYFSELLTEGMQRDLTAEDFPAVEEVENSKNISEKLEMEWNASKSLITVIIKFCIKKCSNLIILYLIELGFNIGTALFLGQLLSWLEAGEDMRLGLLFAFGMLACKFVAMVTHHALFFIAMRIGMQLRVGFIAMIYRKCLLLSGSNSSMTGVIGMVFRLMTQLIWFQMMYRDLKIYRRFSLICLLLQSK